MLLAPEKCSKSIPYLRSGHPRSKTWAKISSASYLLRQCSQEKLLMEFRIGRKKNQKKGGVLSGEIPGTARFQKKLWSLNSKSVCRVSMQRTGLCIILPDSPWVTPGRHKLPGIFQLALFQEQSSSSNLSTILWEMLEQNIQKWSTHHG